MKKILILIVTQILLMSLIGPATVLAASPIVNGSFETGNYTGWTLWEGKPTIPDIGTWGIAANGDTISFSDSTYDYSDGKFLTQLSPGLPITYVPLDGSNFMAYQLQGGTQEHRMYQDVTLAGSATTLSLDMFYTNHSDGFSSSQYLAIHIRDVSNDAILHTFFKTLPGDTNAIPMTAFTFDIPSAFAGSAVRIDVEMNVNNYFFDAGFDNFVIEQGGTPPTADPNGPYAGTVGSPVVLDGSGSSDDGTIVAYDWDFGDGNTGTGTTPTHTYAAPGTYTVSLTVTDDDGGTGTATTTADINAPPVADPNGPYTGTVGSLVALNGSGSSDPDGTIVAYDWDFGDSSTGTGVTPSHTYAAPGTYTVTLTVTDNDGATDTATTTVGISGPPGWEKGKKEGWDGDVPPGLDKKDKTPDGFKKGGKNGWE